MSCALGMIRWLIFLVNFIFALGGLVLLGCGVFLHFNLANTDELPEMQVITYPTIMLMVIGGAVFLIALFGCCGAVQESHCCIVTFAMMLLTLLIIQIAVASYGYWKLKDENLKDKINNKLQSLVLDYNIDNKITARTTVDVLQTFAQCCGYNDYKVYGNDIPHSCCNRPEKQTCTTGEVLHVPGCKDTVFNKLESYGKGLGIGALVIAAVELVGVVFAFCLANSIRNAERRGYKV